MTSEALYCKAIQSIEESEISLSNQDKEENAKSSLSVSVKKQHQLRKKGENLEPENWVNKKTRLEVK